MNERRIKQRWTCGKSAMDDGMQASYHACYHFVVTGLEDWGRVSNHYDSLFCEQVSYEMCFTSSTGQYTSHVTFILVEETRTVSGNKRRRILGSSSAKENLPG